MPDIKNMSAKSGRHLKEDNTVVNFAEAFDPAAKVFNINMAFALSALFDSIDVAKMSKGGVVTAHNAIVATTTSTEVDCRGFNSLLVECDVSAITSGNWVIDVQSTMATGGTVGDCYDMTAGATPVKMSTGTINANGKRTYIFRGIPDYVKIKATRTTDGTLTCKVQPLNL